MNIFKFLFCSLTIIVLGLNLKAKDLEPNSRVIKFNELFAYELKISIIDKTK